MNKIYRIVNTINGDSYIGATTKDIQLRWNDHVQKSEKKIDTKFYKAIEDFGPQAFQIELIDEVESADELARKEVSYIEAFHTLTNGYNSNRGGGFKKSVYQFEYGNPDPIAVYESLQSAGEAVGASKKTISNACLGSLKSARGYLWSYNSECPVIEDYRRKPVYQYSLEGFLINRFASAHEASRILGIGLSSITRCCRGERKQTHGYRFSY